MRTPVRDRERDVLRRARRAWLGGALLGLGAGSGLYAILHQLVEGSGTSLEELGGLLWNIVPFGTALGAALGGLLHDRRRAAEEADRATRAGAVEHDRRPVGADR